MVTDKYRTRVLKERQQEAERAGLDRLAVRVYSDLQYYPSWTQREGGVPSIVTAATERKNEDPKEEPYTRRRKIIDITLLKNRYSFHFEQYRGESGEPGRSAQLEIHDEGRGAGRVFGVRIFEEFNEYYSEWQPYQVNAYIKGLWINDLERLDRAIHKRHKEYRAKCKAEETERHAPAFGISKKTSSLLSSFFGWFRR